MAGTGDRGRGLHAILRGLLALCLSLTLAFQPAFAQSLLRDAESEALFADLSRPLIVAAGLDPRNVSVVVIHDNSINAFVAGGQIVYLHSGLIAAADTAEEVQGVIAHELGHIVGGHIIRIGEGVKTATGITLVSLLLGVAAIAAGAGEAGAGIMAAGQQAATGKFLAFTRTQEAAADEAGATYLSKAGISGRGSLSFFKKLQNLEFRYGYGIDRDSFAYDHPMTGERIQFLTGRYHGDPAWNTPADPAIEARFERVKAKLVGFVSDPKTTLRDYPETDKSIPARYARAYAYHKSAYPEKAVAEVDALLQVQPDDPYFLELKGQVLLESGRPKDAIAPLREAVAETRNQPLIAAMLGHALISTEDPTHFDEARRVLKAAVARDNDNPFAWYQLGIVYDREGDQPRAALATAERYNLIGQPGLALVNAQQALNGLKTGTPDWLRAQDIVMVSRAAAENGKRRR
ncbi:M48 family metalloprotease [Sphingomonas flavalba]|uniref:M48 family metalloprotease n=1 Tax=Sphingomonas flavalba TaxID=2559804 RepID=UPI00109DE985|nr:M48 family metalloprotease [Sphingomonas flavalba]